MSFLDKKISLRSDLAVKKSGGKSKGRIARVRAFGQAFLALRRAAVSNQTSVVLIDGRRVAILPLSHYRRLERLLEKEEKEKELDRLDVEEAERRLADPNDATIPYEQVRRELGLDRLSD